MSNYRVEWAIDAEANSPQEAAKIALAIQRDPCSTATIFDVRDENSTVTSVDLSYPEYQPIMNTAEQYGFVDLTHKVKELLHACMLQVDSQLLKLVAAGSGIVEAHNRNDRSNYTVPRKVVLALLKEYRHQNQPPIHLDSKQYQSDVENIYRLL